MNIQRHQFIARIIISVIATLAFTGCSHKDLASIADSFKGASEHQSQTNRNKISSNPNMVCPPGQYRVNNGYGVFSCQSPSTSTSSSTSNTPRPQPVSKPQTQAPSSEIRTLLATGNGTTTTAACVNAMRSADQQISSQRKVQRFSSCTCSRKSVKLADGRSINDGYSCEISAEHRMNVSTGVTYGYGYGTTRGYACSTAKSNVSNSVFILTSRARRVLIEKLPDCSCSETDDKKNHACMILVSY